MKRHINRDISWLSFNYRVLREAWDEELPLYERIKFMAIYSSNLDEFFRVRVGTIRSLLNDEDEAEKAEKAQKLLDEIMSVVSKQQHEFGQLFRLHIVPSLEKNNIDLLNDEQLSRDQKEYARKYFQDELIYQIQPILLVKNKVSPFLQNGAIYLIVGLKSKNKKRESANKKQVKRRIRYAVIKIPSDIHSRFIELPVENGRHGIIWLDDIIRLNLDQLLRGYEIDSCYSFKVSRDADLHIDDEGEGNIVDIVKKNLSKRKTGAPSRFLYDERMPEHVIEFLRDSFHLKKNEMIPGGKYHNFFDFFSFPNPLSPQLESYIPQPMRLPEFDSYASMFEAIKTKDWLLNYPYQSYDYFIRFLNEAAFDPKVTEIKATQYRVASNSAIVNAFITAARNGKKVTVFVEVKARFDEESNLKSAQQMAAAGIKIIYSIPGLKVHAKACLISRISGNRRGIRDYAFMSTGNFNEKTAKIYCDHGFFTSKESYTDELRGLFEYLETQETQVNFNHLLVAHFNMIDQLKELIDHEIKAAKRGEKAYILIKLNNLEDDHIIDKLYEASEAGVKIDIIIRSICCLVPMQLFSKNITVRRIVDMYLEHARVFIFYHGGENLLYLSSADWMKRNLYHRIELAFPIVDPLLKKELMDILHIQLKDTKKAKILDEHLQHHPIPVTEGEYPIRAQEKIYEYLRNKYFKLFMDD